MLIDSFQRRIDYLRISVTPNCNSMCIYCYPAETLHSEPNLMTLKEIIEFARICASRGIKYIRLTGGEPLLRKNISWLIKELRSIEGIEDVSITTNGLLLERLYVLKAFETITGFC